MRTKRFILRALRIVALAYLGLCLVFSALQESFIFPGSASQGQKHALVQPTASEELVHLSTADGTRIVALFGKALSPEGHALSDTEHRPTMLFFYGNGMCLADCEPEFRAFRRLGVNVLIPDFVGYGMSGGKPSEHGVYDTAETAFQYLLTRSDIDQTRIIPSGWSLGSAAAIELAHQHHSSGLILISTFTSMNDMARQLMPWLPTRLILKHHFENETKLKSITCPVLIIHGRQDRIIPFSMSKKLEQSAGGPVKRVAIDGADHNDIFEVGGDEMLRTIGEFLSQR